MIVAALLTVLLLSAPPYAAPVSSTASGNYLLMAWSGNVALKWAFWPFFLILNISFYAADSLAKTGILTVSSWDDVHIMLLLPTVWWTTSLWRCSSNTPLRLWAAGARLLSLAVFFEYGLKLAIRIHYPRIFFGCEELLLDYGNCF